MTNFLFFLKIQKIKIK